MFTFSDYKLLNFKLVVVFDTRKGYNFTWKSVILRLSYSIKTTFYLSITYAYRHTHPTAAR